MDGTLSKTLRQVYVLKTCLQAPGYDLGSLGLSDMPICITRGFVAPYAVSDTSATWDSHDRRVWQ